MVKAVWRDTVIAASDDTVIVENNHYFRLEDVRRELLRPSQTTSRCGWKGLATYYSIEADGAVNPDAVWTYTDPLPAAAHIKGRVAFWKGVKVG